MVRDQTIRVTSAHHGWRLDRSVLASIPTTTRALVREAVFRGTILINGRRAIKGIRLRRGDVIDIKELAEKADIKVQPEPDLPLQVLQEDTALFALDKPAGQPVHPLTYRETGTLLNALIGRYPELQSIGPNPLLPAVVHRIDTDTSGVVLAARTQAAYEALRAQFRTHQVRKTYMAVVHGRVRQAGQMESWLFHNRQGGQHRMVAPAPAPVGQRKKLRATTAYEPLDVHRDRTLLRVTIRTGVTHQIRCQLAYAGFPIVGDRLYGSSEITSSRLFLHAAELTLFHPADGRMLTFRSPLPDIFNLRQRQI